MRTVPNGCGEGIKDREGRVVITCGEHIDIEDIYEDGIARVEPVLCDWCWTKFNGIKNTEGTRIVSML